MEVIIFVQDCHSKENLSMPLWSRNSKLSVVCKHCMIWANSPLILEDWLVLHGKLLYIETFLLIDHFYISLPVFPLLLLSGANMLIQDSSQGSCLLAAGGEPTCLMLFSPKLYCLLLTFWNK